MSDTVILALITAVCTISAAFIAHLDRHHIDRRARSENVEISASLRDMGPPAAAMRLPA